MPSSTNELIFGVIADVQWADADDGYNYARTKKRCYRGSLRTLDRAVDWWNNLPSTSNANGNAKAKANAYTQTNTNTPLHYIAQLGDLIDGINAAEKLNQRDSALQSALDILERSPVKPVNIVGNHELYNFNRLELSQATWLQHGDAEYYSFTPIPGWRTIVLDPYQLSLMGFSENDPRRIESVELLAKKNPNVHPDGRDGDWLAGFKDGDCNRRFVPYNGGFGSIQLAWLRKELAGAKAAGEKVVVMSHVILHPLACGGTTMAWDYEEALSILGDTTSMETDVETDTETFSKLKTETPVVAVLSGHDHRGNYHRCPQTGIHHCTFSSPLNKGDDGYAFGLVRMTEDGMEIRGPRVDDLLPNVEGRPQMEVCDGDDITGPCEQITLPFRSRDASTPAERNGNCEAVPVDVVEPITVSQLTI